MTPASGGEFTLQCPIPIAEYPQVLMAHGGGGRLMNQLIERLFLAAFANPHLENRHDGAVLSPLRGRIAFTTDSYVVRPLFFPGGDIGSLAVNGTVNDLAMCGARPLYLSAGFILEEGLPMETLWQVAQSMRRAADAAGVAIVTGDTKVVDRGSADGLFVNTAGIGVVPEGVLLAPRSVRAGDAVLLSGDLGRHGIAIMAKREGLEFESPVESDCAPLSGMVAELLATGAEVHCLRDLTRGGLASALVEIAGTAGCGIRLSEAAIPICEPVRGACEILGFDPLYVANEGRLVAFVERADASRALSALRAHQFGAEACQIGTVTAADAGLVLMESRIGGTRQVEMMSGEQLPRIC